MALRNYGRRSSEPAGSVIGHIRARREDFFMGFMNPIRGCFDTIKSLRRRDNLKIIGVDCHGETTVRNAPKPYPLVSCRGLSNYKYHFEVFLSYLIM